jgi:hypothetical protein
MIIKPTPESGFVTRTGRHVYGQEDYRRDQMRVMGVALIVVSIALLCAVMVVL